jgi:serine/threonine-protein kinase
MDTPAPPPSDPQADPLVGSVLAGRYRIVRRLGEGAMGAVYLGEHLRFGRLDAIKVLRSEMASDTEATERFLRGARNVSAINHPNVCTVYDFGDTEDGRQFLAMEFVEGETLADLIEREGRLPLDRTVEIVVQIARALDAAHHAGIVHRDLKPGNVMIGRGRGGADEVKVVDFDIAKGATEGAGAEVTRTGFVVGTPEYMSPEQLIGDPVDGRSDVYSLAVVFVRALTGSLPVRATSTQDLMVERLTQEPLPLAEVAPELALPRGLQAALDRGLQRRREDRPASAGDFAAGVKEAAGTEEAPVAPPPRRDEERGRKVPPTAVGAAPTPDEVEAARGTPARGGRRVVPWLAGGAVAVAVVIAAAVALTGDGDDAGVGAPPTPSPSEQPVAALSDDRPDTADVTDAPQVTSGGEAAAGAPAQARPEEAGGDPGEVATLEPPVDAATPPLPTPAALDTQGARDMLGRQLEALMEPSQARRDAALDSALLAFDQRPGLPDEVRALAAYVAASVYMERQARDDALSWVRRAVRLDPANRGAQLLLDQLGGVR